MCACMERERKIYIHTHVYIWHPVSKATNSPYAVLEQRLCRACSSISTENTTDGFWTQRCLEAKKKKKKPVIKRLSQLKAKRLQ